MSKKFDIKPMATEIVEKVVEKTVVPANTTQQHTPGEKDKYNDGDIESIMDMAKKIDAEFVHN